jgi:hypothetical protein
MSDHAKYGYKKFSLTLDPADQEEKRILDWLVSVRNRKNKYNDILKRAVKALMEKEKQDDTT